MLQNLIFGGKSTNNGNVNSVVNFGGDFQGSQLNFNGNMGGGDINQGGSSSATGAGFDFNFDFSGPSMPGVPGATLMDLNELDLQNLIFGGNS